MIRYYVQQFDTSQTTSSDQHPAAMARQGWEEICKDDYLNLQPSSTSNDDGDLQGLFAKADAIMNKPLYK